MLKLAFDLDETLGVPLIAGAEIVGWQARPGSVELLTALQSQFTLCLWSVSSRRYVDKALSFGLSRWFQKTFSWDDIAEPWKDVRRIGASFLVDDSPHHRGAARKHGLEAAYIVVPAYGSPEDTLDPLGWKAQVERTLQGGHHGNLGSEQLPRR